MGRPDHDTAAVCSGDMGQQCCGQRGASTTNLRSMPPQPSVTPRAPTAVSPGPSQQFTSGLGLGLGSVSESSRHNGLPDGAQAESQQHTAVDSSPTAVRSDRQQTSTEASTDSRVMELRAVAQGAQQQAAKVDKSLKWKEVQAPEELHDCSVEVHKGPQVIARVQCTIDANIDQVLQTISSGKQTAPSTTCCTLEHVAPNIELLHIKLFLPLVKDRDFVCCQMIDSDNSGQAHEVVCVSLPAEQADLLVPPKPSKFVRGSIVLQSTLLTPHPSEPGKCRLKWISCVDLAGSIPTVKVLTAQKGAAAIVALQQAVLSRVLDIQLPTGSVSTC